MKYALVFFPALMASLPTAAAGPCAALDYQEMKDMSAEQLTKVACDYRTKMSDSFDERLSNLGARRGAAPLSNAQESYDQCSGQIDRIDRVLENKGVAKETLVQTCRAQAAEQKAAIDRLLNRSR